MRAFFGGESFFKKKLWVFSQHFRATSNPPLFFFFFSPPPPPPLYVMLDTGLNQYWPFITPTIKLWYSHIGVSHIKLRLVANLQKIANMAEAKISPSGLLAHNTSRLQVPGALHLHLASCQHVNIFNYIKGSNGENKPIWAWTPALLFHREHGVNKIG